MKQNHTLLYSFDAGNGSCRAKSSEVQEIIQFEPVIAPLTNRRGIHAADEHPTYSLKVDGQTLVCGIDDVFAHGKRASVRRLNSAERYTNADYFRLLGVLYLHAFAAYRGCDVIAPTGTVSVPIAIYNNQEIVDEIRNVLSQKRELTDHEGCTLHLDIQPKRLLIIPESYGALMHHAYDPGSLKKRPEANTAGTTLVVDIGYETTDFSLFEGLKFQRDRAESAMRAGMGIVARAIHEYVNKSHRSTDVSRVDRAIRVLAGKAPAAPKTMQPTPGVDVEVTEIYDSEIESLAMRIAQEVLTRYPEAITHILLAGGGAYHLGRLLREYLSPLPVEIVPDADVANVLGGFTALKLQLSRSS